MEITTTTTIGFISLGAIAALAVAARWPRRRTTTIGSANGRSSRQTRSESHQWFGGDPVYYLGGDGGSADCGGAADGGGGCD